MGSPRFDAMKYWIVDSLAIEEYVLEKMAAMEAAGSDLGAAYTNNDVPMAFVATNTGHRDNIRHYMRLLEGARSVWKARLFDDLESARQWIS